MPKIRSKGRPPGKAKPSETLPTERVSFAKQLDILRAYAIASGPSGKSATNADVAGIVKMAASTVALCNPFFTSVGFLESANGNGYVPTEHVSNFSRAFEWNAETAAQKLAPAIEGTWFADRIVQKVSFSPMDVDAAVSDLAEACGAGPRYRSNLQTLVEYLDATGFVSIADGRVYPKKATQARTNEPESERVDNPSAPSQRESPVRSVASAMKATEGAIQFHVSVKVDMAEMESWTPDRISSFFAGVAQVLAAKGAIEEEAASE